MSIMGWTLLCVMWLFLLMEKAWVDSWTNYKNALVVESKLAISIMFDMSVWLATCFSHPAQQSHII